MSLGRSLFLLGLFCVAIAIGAWEGLQPGLKEPLDPLSVRVSLRSDGSLRLETPSGSDLELGRLVETDPEAADATLQRLRTELRKQDLTPRDPAGYSERILDLRGSPTAPWKSFLWIMEAAVDLQVS